MEFIVRINRTMGRVIARAWSDSEFKSRLMADPTSALAELAIALPLGTRLIARENTDRIIHLALSAPPQAVTSSPLSDIRDFAEVYRDPQLWSLNWAGRDPVAANRLSRKPALELEKFGLACPDELQIVILSNTADLVHLLLPPPPHEAHCTPALLAGLAAGHAPAALRYGRWFGPERYEALLASIVAHHGAAADLMHA
jgi:hypothetical protein